MKLRTSTLALGLLAGSSLWLAWADPWQGGEDRTVLVSNRSAARRLFPGLGERSLAEASFEFQNPTGVRVRIVPSPDGRHVVMQGETLLGPVDPEALGGIWSSLRMATTLRAVAPGSDIGAERGGIIRIAVGDDALELELGKEAPDGSGLYGVLRHEGEAAWVVEEELAWLVEQSAASWLSRRLSELDLDELRGVAWGEAFAVERGSDQLWRVGQGPDPLLLSTQAVELRLDRLMHAQLEPLLMREEIGAEVLDARPWLFVHLADGQTRTWVLGGECPGHPERRVVDRGPGMLGCVDANLVPGWNEGEILERELLEARLSPLAYGHVLSVELKGKAKRMLRRRTGGWLLDDEERTHEVPDDEVYRWYQSLAEAQFDLNAPPLEPGTLEVVWRVSIASSPEDRLELACGTVAGVSQGADKAAWACARGRAAPRRLLGQAPEFAFDAESLADRRVVRFAMADVRSVEAEGALRVRQSLRQDLGVWRLDDPVHPDGDAAIDQVRVENVLGALSSLRAVAWVPPPAAPAQRVWRVVTSPGGVASGDFVVRVFDDCVAEVPGKRAFKLSERACEVLGLDLLFDDPLRQWLREASSVQITQEAPPSRDDEIAPSISTQLFRRRGETWSRSDGGQLRAPWTSHFERWYALRTESLVPGQPPTPAQFSFALVRDNAAPLSLSLGQDWLRFGDAHWFYRLAAHDAGPAATESAARADSDTVDGEGTESGRLPPDGADGGDLRDSVSGPTDHDATD